MSELRPCPFCGETKAKAGEQPHNCGWFVYCPNCYVLHDNNITEGPDDDFDKDEAIKAWNTRADDWISVKTKYPENSDDVLISYADRTKHIVGFWDGETWRPRTYIEGTHWKPITPPGENK